MSLLQVVAGAALVEAGEEAASEAEVRGHRQLAREISLLQAMAQLQSHMYQQAHAANQILRARASSGS
jgi:hypothetical protein